MRIVLLTIYRVMRLLGFDPGELRTLLRELPSFLRDYRELRRQHKKSARFGRISIVPVLGERDAPSGTASGAYFHQDLLVARRIFDAKPQRHVDVGSRIDGFVAHVAVFREIEVVDIRPQRASIKNVVFLQYDMMRLPRELHSYCDSASSLHALEHFGLGRYGDPIDYEGHLSALEGIHTMLRPGGRFYFSVPIGEQRIEFNAHRVFDVRYLLRVLADRFRVERFSYVDDRGLLTENVRLDDASAAANFGCRLGCGIFELVRR